MIAAAMRTWEQAAIEEALGEHAAIEEALGEHAAGVLPEAIRLVELRARVPRYQRDMLRYLAQGDGTSVDQVLARELEDVACAHSEELAPAVPGFGLAQAWPEERELGRQVRRRRAPCLEASGQWMGLQLETAPAGHGAPVSR